MGTSGRSGQQLLRDPERRKIAVGALLARHWPENSRHEASLRCGGFLARVGWEPDMIEAFMRAVQCAAGVTNRSHVENGCRAAFDAATQHRADGKGYGLPAMKEVFGEEVCNRLVKLLQYRAIDKNVELDA